MTACRSRASSVTRRPGRRILLLMLTLILLLPAMLIPVGAIPEEAPPSTEVGAALVCNLENNLLLYEKEADTPIYPSSSVKIMTGLLACRELSERQTETVTVTAAMLSGVEGRRMVPPLADGEVITVRDLLYAAICGSYNDAACVLACLVSGSVAAFVEDMNEEAQRLSTACTYYTNPTGLHDPAMSTSVRDVSIIAREAYGNSLFMQISSTRTHTVPATNLKEERSFTNRNALISDTSGNYRNGYCKGMNAGMTDEGGWCVVTVCERGGASNLCIVMRGIDLPSDELVPAYVYANRLLSWANRNYSYRTVLAAGETLETLPVGMTGISKSKVDLVPQTELKVYLPVDASAEGSLSYTLDIQGGELVAPLKAGEVVGTVTVTYGGRTVGRAPLTVTKDFSRNGFVSALMVFRRYLTSRPCFITLPLFLIMLLIYLRATTGSGGRYGLRTVRRRRRIRYTKRHF